MDDSKQTFWFIRLMVCFFSISLMLPIPAQSQDANELRVLAWNVNLLPNNGPNDNGRRVLPISEVLNASRADVIVLSELQSNTFSFVLMQRLRVNFPFNTRVLGRDGGNEDGGVAIFSRWPITTSQEIVFSRGNNWDYFSNKGVMYARIDKLNRIYHVFGTHAQAIYNNNETHKQTRDGQFAEAKTFIDGLNLPNNELVVLAGDLNVNFYDRSEYNAALRSMRMHSPDLSGIQRRPATYSPRSNTLRPGDSRAELLDYVLFSRDHLRPSMAASWVRQMRIPGGLPDDPSIVHASDHYAIEARFLVQPSQRCADAARAWSGGKAAADANAQLNEQQITNLCLYNQTRRAPVRCYRWLMAGDVDWSTGIPVEPFNWGDEIAPSAAAASAFCSGVVFERAFISCVNRRMARTNNLRATLERCRML